MNMIDDIKNKTNFSSPSGGWGANPFGYYGEFGGAYIPEILHGIVEKLKEAYFAIKTDESFKAEYYELLKNYVGRPSPLYFAKRLSEEYGTKIYLKREDLNHTGAHKAGERTSSPGESSCTPGMQTRSYSSRR